jgi:hypothetical protein
LHRFEFSLIVDRLFRVSFLAVCRSLGSSIFSASLF